VALGLLLVSMVAKAQDGTETRTLTEQYKSLNSQMEVIDGYRTVRLYVMDKFWGTVMDSIRTEHKVRLAAEQEVTELKEKITGLKSKHKDKEAQTADLSEAVDNLNVAGIAFSKGGFIAITFVVIAALAVLLVFALLSTRMSYRAVKDMKRLYENTNNEFDRYKHNAVEKEIKLSRELQDYKNRYSEVDSH
jgi:DNA repair exonuclease SbcCD ATPase subunit